MNDVEKSLQRELKNLESNIAQMKNGGAAPNFVKLFGVIDDLTNQLPRDTDPQLLHYLHKKSYEKAINYLDGRDHDNTNGGCLRD